jgi:hypothetical protein
VTTNQERRIQNQTYWLRMKRNKYQGKIGMWKRETSRAMQCEQTDCLSFGWHTNLSSINRQSNIPHFLNWKFQNLLSKFKRTTLHNEWMEGMSMRLICNSKWTSAMTQLRHSNKTSFIFNSALFTTQTQQIQLNLMNK